jgi:chemotaxis signal transduction protein
MEALAAERKALLMTAGGVRLALRLSHVREVVTAPADAPAESFGGAAVVEVASVLGLRPGAGELAIFTDAPRLALRVDAVSGIVELGRAEVFQLPARTALPDPPPFLGALVHGGAVALELAPVALVAAPRPLRPRQPAPPAAAPSALGAELLFVRGERTYRVPIQLLSRVIEDPVVHSVPLTPAAHRGLLYHERALHPVFDVGALHGEQARTSAASALLVDAGGEVVAVLADRVLPPGAPVRDAVRPSWDTLFG